MAKSPSVTRVKAAESALRRRPEAGTCPPEAPSSRPWCGSRLLCHGCVPGMLLSPAGQVSTPGSLT